MKDLMSKISLEFIEQFFKPSVIGNNSYFILSGNYIFSASEQNHLSNNLLKKIQVTFSAQIIFKQESKILVFDSFFFKT